MAWNGSGVFTRTNGVNNGTEAWQDDAAAGTDILASRHDTHDQDLATGIQACLTKNGESKPTADFSPNVTSSYDLGTTSLKWEDLHLNGNALIGGTLGVTGNTTVTGTLGVTGLTTVSTATATGLITTNGQVKFPATQNPSADANTLDDYEEGEYTAVITPGTSGTITLNSASDTLGYIKIGRFVHVQGTIAVSSVSSPVGTIQISLPFDGASDITENGDTAYGSCFPFGFSSAPSGSIAYVSVASGASNMIVFDADYTSHAFINANTVQASTTFAISIRYISDS